MEGPAIPKLDSETFDHAIYDEEGPAAVLFTRRTCPVCHSVRPIVGHVQKMLADGSIPPKVRLFEVDAEESFDLAQRFCLAGVPELLLFEDGELRRRHAGKVAEEELLGFLGI